MQLLTHIIFVLKLLKTHINHFTYRTVTAEWKPFSKP